MNLFVLDKDPIVAAQLNCDRHVVKIILEAYEMLGYAYVERGIKYEPMPRIHGVDKFPFRSHYAHPMSKWVRASEANFHWALEHVRALQDEYTKRYAKKHKYHDFYLWILDNPLTFKESAQTDWPRCFGKYKDILIPTNDAIADYRGYYIAAKARFAKWKNGGRPTWMN